MPSMIRRLIQPLLPRSCSGMRAKTVAMRLESLEERECPAVFNPTDAASLIAAINQANTNNQPDVINLVPNGVYTFTQGLTDPNAGGLSGLPSIAQDGGSVFNSITIHGNGATLTRPASAAQFRIINISGGDLFLDSVTITGGFSNAGLFGGAIRVEDPANVTGSTNNLYLRDSLLTGNNSTGAGGALDLSNGAKATVVDTTITNNIADQNGGGVEQIGSNTTLILINDTITNNVARFGSFGNPPQGGGVSADDGTLYLLNSILANNLVGANNITTPDDLRRGTAFVAVVNVRNSLIQETPPAQTINGQNVSNIFGQSPNLGALQNNGGLTRTMALLAGSPAIDAGDNIRTAGETNDQRGAGFNRVIGPAVDMGAYEFQPPAVNVGISSSGNPSVYGQTVIFSTTVLGVASNSNTPQGTVTFLIDRVAYATVALNNGVARIALANLTPGNHSIQSIYNPARTGDFGFAAGLSPLLTETIATPAPITPARSPHGRRWNR